MMNSLRGPSCSHRSRRGSKWSSRKMISAEDRYRTLLDASSAMADQPTVKAVLQSLRSLLSSTSKLHGTELYLLDDEEDSLRVLVFDRDADAPAIKVGTKVLRVGAVARVMDEQEPIFVP